LIQGFNMRAFWLVLIIVFSFGACNYSTPSDVRFEKTTGIFLTDSITILQDRFEESGPDYGLYFEFKLKENDCIEIMEIISKSKDWEKIDNGWKLYKTDDGIIFNISFSIDDCKIIYREELI